jgi:hypothetical protein
LLLETMIAVSHSVNILLKGFFLPNESANRGQGESAKTKRLATIFTPQRYPSSPILTCKRGMLNIDTNPLTSNMDFQYSRQTNDRANGQTGKRANLHRRSRWILI